MKRSPRIGLLGRCLAILALCAFAVSIAAMPQTLWATDDPVEEVPASEPSPKDGSETDPESEDEPGAGLSTEPGPGEQPEPEPALQTQPEEGPSPEDADGEGPTTRSAETTFAVGDGVSLADAIAAMKETDATELVLVLEADATDAAFSGIAGKHVMVSSGGGARSIKVAASLEGDVTFENVNIVMDDYGHLSANGHALVLDDACTTEERIEYLVGGGWHEDVEGDTYLTVRGGSFKYIFGGGYAGDVSGSTNVVIDRPIDSDVVYGVYGGGYGVSVQESATVCGDTFLKIEGGKLGLSSESVLSGVYGGGAAGDAKSGYLEGASVVAGSTNVTLCGAAVAQDDYAHPPLAAGSQNGDVMGDANLTIADGSCNTYTDRYGNINQRFFITGAGKDDRVHGVVNVSVTGGDNGEETPSGNTYEGADLYLGGYNHGSEVLNENGEPYALNATVSGGTIANIIGGKRQSAMVEGGAAHLTVRGGVVGQVGGNSYYDDPLDQRGLIDVDVTGGWVWSYRNVRDVVYDGYHGGDDLVLKSFNTGQSLTITGGSDLRMGQHFFAELYGSTVSNVQAFNGINDLIVEGGSTLELDEGCAYIHETSTDDARQDAKLVVDGATLIVNGYLSVGRWSTTPASATNPGSMELKNGAELYLMSVTDPTHFWNGVAGSYTSDGTASIYMPVVNDEIAGHGNFDEDSDSARLYIAGDVTGTTNVYLTDYQTGEPVVLGATRDWIGQNYIVAKHDSNDNFVLANEGADDLSIGFAALTNVNDGAHALNSYGQGSLGSSYDMWQVQTVYTMTFDKNGGDTEAEPNAIAAEYQEEKKFLGIVLQEEGYFVKSLPTVEPTRTGAHFIEWNYVADGSGNEVTLPSGGIKIEQDTTVYAIWGATVQFDLNYDGAAEDWADDKDVSLRFGATGALLAEDDIPEPPARDGYTFVGWYPAQDGSGDELSTSTIIDADATYYAKWAPVATPLKPTATSLVAYEGGMGTNGVGGDTGNALPAPVWRYESEGWTLYIDGIEQPAGTPAFQWGYFPVDGDSEQVDAAATGVYELRAWALEGDPEVIANDAAGNVYVLDLGEDPEPVLDADGAVVTVSVRDVVNDDAAEALSDEVLRPVHEGAHGIAAMARAAGGPCDPSRAHAHAAQGTSYVKNGDASMPVAADHEVSLLYDDLIADVLGEREGALDDMARSAVGGNFAQGGYDSLFKYIDLVDQDDGNIWVATADGSSVTVFIPYTGTMTADSEIAAVRFENLTRDYTVGGSDDEIDAAVAASSAVALDVAKDADGITIEIPAGKFGPIEIMWLNPDGAEEPGTGQTPGDEAPAPDGDAQGSDDGQLTAPADEAGSGETLAATGDATLTVVGAVLALGVAAIAGGSLAALRRRE